uniref:C2H2-type domain-containing protein n=1 Tax=Cacopsylla melanoneura TaxID=428564 RepID=A0A8D9A8H2_9HEMI
MQHFLQNDVTLTLDFLLSHRCSNSHTPLSFSLPLISGAIPPLPTSVANFSPSFLWQLINTHQINYCLTCAKTYKYKHDLKRHVLYECTKEKNFHCEYCKKSYRRESYLKMHVCAYKKHHLGSVALNVRV